ncbi:hypothetical protein TRIP_B330441 [uncultured Desulfatiglans sp.]|nr:hypothetical protein TRIP_B330441 [uncultured Desulfatiglans sp.]
MVFLAHLGVHLHVCLCGDLQVASAQTLDFLDIGQTDAPVSSCLEVGGAASEGEAGTD